MKKLLFVYSLLTVSSFTLVACGEEQTQLESPKVSLGKKTAPPAPAPDPLAEVNRYLGRFIDLPEVTEPEVEALQLALTGLRAGSERTSIVAMSAFRAAEAKTSIGLYHAVMGVYPSLDHVDGRASEGMGGSFEFDGRYGIFGFSEATKAAIIFQWESNPDLPLVYTTVAEDEAFAARLSQMTGRRFSVMTDSQNEYSIRGRARNPDGSWGAITTTDYFFGDDHVEVENHAFITTFYEAGIVHGVHEIPAGRDDHYRNSFGLIHPIGNVWSRSREGVIRGGAFSFRVGSCSSSHFRMLNVNLRLDSVGFRLAEEL